MTDEGSREGKMNRNVAAKFLEGLCKRYVYNCRHLPFENANRTGHSSAGLTSPWLTPLSGIPATHPTNERSCRCFKLSYGLGSGSSAWFHFLPASCCDQGQALTSRTHFAPEANRAPRVVVAIFCRSKHQPSANPKVYGCYRLRARRRYIPCAVEYECRFQRTAAQVHSLTSIALISSCQLSFAMTEPK